LEYDIRCGDFVIIPDTFDILVAGVLAHLLVFHGETVRGQL